MNIIPAKKIKSRPQNWISLIKFVEIRSKQKVRLPYCNLYAYAANNPVHYIDPDGRCEKEKQYTIEEVYFFGSGTIDTNLNGYGFCFQKIVYGDIVQVEKEIKNIKLQVHDQFNDKNIKVTKDTRIYLSMSNMVNTYQDIDLIQNIKGTIYFSDQKAPDNFLNENKSIYFYYKSEKYFLCTEEETGKQYVLDTNYKKVGQIE